jgi:hypothetical protein
MARASTYTLLPLDTWARILGISPWEFNQFEFPVSKSAQCKDVQYQFPWQKDHLSREEVAEAIANAEQMIADQLLYWPAPKYFVDEVVQYPRPRQRDAYGGAGTPRGQWKTVQLQWHQIISAGVFNRTAIDTIPTADIVKKDFDSDGIFESFEATITDAIIGTITDPNQIAIYFGEDDRVSEPLSETWRVRPVRVTISGTTATIIGHRTLLAKTNLEYAVDASPIDSSVDGNYVTELECYRVFTDTTATEAQPYQGIAAWSTVPGCTANCTFQVKDICLAEYDNEQGVVSPVFGLPCYWPYADREPDRLEVNYLAGLPLINGQMQDEMAKAVTYLSTSLLAGEKCGCERSNRILAHWQAPFLTFDDQVNKAKGFSKDYSGSPFPATRGGQWAWKRVKDWRHMESVSL